MVATSFAAMTLAVLSAPHAAAVVVSTKYTIVPGTPPLDWNTSTNWTPVAPGTGVLFPGADAPTLGDTTLDLAIVSGDFGGVAQTVDISVPLTNPLRIVALGDTSVTPGTTTIQSTNGTSLRMNGGGFLISAGTAPIVSPATPGATNIVSAPVTLGGNLTIGSYTAPVPPADASDVNIAATNDLTITGKVTGSDITKTVTNSSGRVVTFGDIDLKTTTTNLTTSILNSNGAGERIILGGVISNSGGAALSNFAIGGGGAFELPVNNTYVGNTVVGVNAGGRTTTYYINTTQPFGLPATAGSLTFGGNGGTVNILEAVTTDRTITKNGNTTINRDIRFQGTLALTIDSADMRTSNSPIFTNNIITAGKIVTLGRAAGTWLLNNNATDKNVNRQLYAGAGTTVILSNILDNSGAVAVDSFNGIQMNGTGVFKLTGTSTFQGPSRIISTGTLQLGNGGSTGSLLSGNGLTPIVTSNATGTGFLAFNRSDNHTATLVANGPLGIKQNGSGAVTLTNSQFHTGTNTVGDGIAPSKLVVNGSLVPAVSTTSDATVASVTAGNGTYRTITLAGADTITSLNLKVGQPVYLTSGSASAGSYIHKIDPLTPTVVTVFGISQLAASVTPVALTFGAGSALGTSASVTTVKALSTLSGTGSIAGPVAVEGSLAPGASVGTLSTGPLTFSGGSSLAIEIDTLAGTADKVVVTGDVLTGASTVNLSLTDVSGGLLTVGQKLTLVDYSGTWPATDLLTYAGNPVADGSSIILGGHTFTVNYADVAVDGTALTLTVTAASITPFQTWINGYVAQLPNFADRQPTADPDHDDRDNLLEYALNGNPADGSNNGKLVLSTADSGDVGTDGDLSVTLAVVSGASLGAGPNGSATLSVGGMVYTIQGSENLLVWDKAVNQVTPASTLVPAPDAGWDTFTFQVTDSNGLPDKRFIRVGVQ